LQPQNNVTESKLNLWHFASRGRKSS